MHCAQQPITNNGSRIPRTKNATKAAAKVNPLTPSLAVQINEQIIALSQGASVQPLLEFVIQNMEQMNVVNLSTAVHRLAKLASSDSGTQLAEVREHPVVAKLFQAILEQFQSFPPGTPQPQAISNIAWSLATLGFTGNMELVEKLAQLTADTMWAYRFRPYELTSVIWAFAKLVSPSGDKVAWAPDWLFKLFNEVAVYVSERIGDYGFRLLATIARSFATMRCPNVTLFRSVADEMPKCLRSCSEKTTAQHLTDALWAFATVRFQDVHLFSILADNAFKQLGKFKPQELSVLVWALAENGFWHEKLFLRAGEHAKRMIYYRHCPKFLAVILSAYARIRPGHSGVHAVVCTLLPACTKHIKNFKPVELSMTASSMALIFQHHVKKPAVMLDFFAAAAPLIVQQVKHYSEQSLLDIATAFSVLRLSGDTDGCVEAIQAEAMSRGVDHLGHGMLINFFSFFVTVRTKCASKLLADFDQLDQHEMQMLSHVIYGILTIPKKGQQLAPNELREHLSALASETGPAASGDQVDSDLRSFCDDSETLDVDFVDHIAETPAMKRDDNNWEVVSDTTMQDEGEFFVSPKFTKLVESWGFVLSTKNSFLSIEQEIDNASDGSSITESMSSSCGQRSRSLPPMRFLGMTQEKHRTFA
eukprot:gnl/TRDRNA2_/TRDRNA2_177701_c0_seq2.p1 gnl/TRDRNA2_/TRDRNA2_177701_c0~~gnl/TRDRNA2_/TRDRNA2_177701_c0_seq2.p1  ORF type:complete len:647 (-),score=118.12 gnl/TRDRNA2_/TRDRNA2_177701_c0_seq2:463-2403(-)